MTALECLRIYGPCGVSEIAERTKMHRDVVLVQIENYVFNEAAIETRESVYDITEKGIELFERYQNDKRRIAAQRDAARPPCPPTRRGTIPAFLHRRFGG